MDRLVFGIHTRHEFDRERIEKASFINAVGKPVGGLWLSPIKDGQSEWERFCEKELEGRLSYSYFYHIAVTFEQIQVFSSPPTTEELQAVLADASCAGFYLTGIHFGWDVQSLWVKDDRNFISMEEKGSRNRESA